MNPFWKIAIIGSGPAGFYSAGELFRQEKWPVKVDIFDKLPTPFGLVRGGVAPDHQKIKSVTKIFERIAEKENFRFFGNVEFGKDLKNNDLLELYDAVIYSVGSSSDRALGIPGENLSGSHSATEFVAWYNGHPDFRDKNFNLSVKNAFVIGNGNVALDVARILAKTPEELAQTDIADHALKVLNKSKIENIWLLGRRGPVQAAFSPIELREFLELADAEISLDSKELDLDIHSKKILEINSTKDVKKNFEILKKISLNKLSFKNKKVHLKFLCSPIEICGKRKVEKIKLVKNELKKQDDGSLRPYATKEIIQKDANLVFRSIGYRGEALDGLPFDEKSGTIPNECGQVLDSKKPKVLRKREYVAGWIKRGPSGVIGTNKPDAVETVNRILENFSSENYNSNKNVSKLDIEDLLKTRKVKYVSFSDWKIIDDFEKKAGEVEGRPRKKITSIEEILKIISKRR